MDSKEILCYLAVVNGGDQQKIMEAIRTQNHPDEEEVMKTIRRLKSRWVTLLDKDYPAALRLISMPPVVLFYRGNLSLISDYNRCVSLVGARAASSYGLEMAEKLSRGAASNGYAVISGLAKGVDTAAAQGALPFGAAVAVLGNGMNNIYPMENAQLQRQIEKGGLLLSEYPDDVKPAARHFPARNRIIAGLSKATVITEAKFKSGSMITCAFALDYCRDVGAVPYRADEESACNAIIKEGAAMIENVEDLLTLMHIPTGEIL